MITIKEFLIETDINIYNKLTRIKNKKTKNKFKNKKISEKLSQRDIEELMGHSSYKRHKGAYRQVN